MEDIAVLKQSLPYLRAYRGKTFVVKFGGEVVGERGNFDNLAADLSLLHEFGIRLVIIHGGGPQLTDMATRLGVAPVKVAGRRITLQPGQKGTLKDLPDLPADIGAQATAAYIRDVVAGNKPVPASIEQQVEHILQLALQHDHAS